MIHPIDKLTRVMQELPGAFDDWQSTARMIERGKHWDESQSFKQAESMCDDIERALNSWRQQIEQAKGVAA